jgi:hypothetical protein
MTLERFSLLTAECVFSEIEKERKRRMQEMKMKIIEATVEDVATIDPELQNKIVDMLPRNYDRALSLLCQMVANVALCNGDKSWGLDKVKDRIEAVYMFYQSIDEAADRRVN